jgi:hypothetical protein
MSGIDENACVQSIGIILVHGVGEQRRFEHLDWQGRDIIRALSRQPDVETTVEIGTTDVAAIHAEHDTWNAGPQGPVKVFVRTRGRLTHCFHFHEVWWSDVNERYSVAKQLRFWAWGLAVWNYPPGNPKKMLHGTTAVTSPKPPSGVTHHGLWQRARLFMIGVFFLTAAFPVGILLVVIQRLFNLEMPALLKTVTNYVSGVKLFNQRSRYGRGFKPANEDFLDTLDEPPRVSVRRRMIRAIVTVAQARYKCWYIIAHSQGTVAALNGLMETPFAWPGYFNETAWRELCACGFGGPGNVPPGNEAETMPRRPVWAARDEVAYRARIFERFRGLLTLGSPLGKFAAIWPARVPISRIPAFRENTVWLNVFDPLDPVSGVMEAYRGHPATVCPTPKDIGYAASSILLLAHLRYFAWTGRDCLVDGVAHWLLTGDNNKIIDGPGRFAAGSRSFRRRRVAVWAWWIVVFTVLTVVAGWSVRIVFAWLFTPTTCACTPPDTFGRRVVSALDWLWQADSRLCVLGVGVVALVATLVVGQVSRWLLFEGEKDFTAPPTEGEPINDVDPDPPSLPPWPSVSL